MTSVRLALGLDGGGTQTRAQIVTPDGAVCGEGNGGACNIAFLPPEDALASAWAASQAALAQANAEPSDVLAVCAGVAGWSFPARRALFLAGLQERFPRAIVQVVPDYAIALSGALDNAPGILVIAGTGSVAYGEDGTGGSHKAGGYGYLIDDVGSGYGVGRAALAAILRAADGTGEATTLTARVLSRLALSDVSDIVSAVYGGVIDRVTIAALSRVAAEATEEDGDAVARALLMHAGGALARLAHAVTARLSFPDAVPVACIGGLWNAGAGLTDVFTRSLHRAVPQAVLNAPLHSPVRGAALRALCFLSLS